VNDHDRLSLTDEQWALRELAHDFAEKEIRPVAWAYDRAGTWPQAVIERAWEVGLMNAHIPEEYGGAGASFIDDLLIAEELGWGCSGIGTSISCNGLASAPVLLGGSEQVKRSTSRC
jgi:acyl-CoA dehydrogenase